MFDSQACPPFSGGAQVQTLNLDIFSGVGGKREKIVLYTGYRGHPLDPRHSAWNIGAQKYFYERVKDERVERK